MKKIFVSIFSALILTGIAVSPANAHVSTNLKGFPDVAGQSSTVYFRLGHGCASGANHFGTSVFEVVVPSIAGTPKPEFKAGFKASVVASATKNAAGAPDAYTVTWTSKLPSSVIDDGTFADFGISLKWSTDIKTITKVNFPTTQTCKAGTRDINTGIKTPINLYLRWNIVDGSTQAATADTEYGPAPSVTVKPAA
jgi:uncharacterized protein YcnI